MVAAEGRAILTEANFGDYLVQMICSYSESDSREYTDIQFACARKIKEIFDRGAYSDEFKRRLCVYLCTAFDIELFQERFDRACAWRWKQAPNLLADRKSVV